MTIFHLNLMKIGASWNKMGDDNAFTKQIGLEYSSSPACTRIMKLHDVVMHANVCQQLNDASKSCFCHKQRPIIQHITTLFFGTIIKSHVESWKQGFARMGTSRDSCNEHMRNIFTLKHCLTKGCRSRTFKNGTRVYRWFSRLWRGFANELIAWLRHRQGIN